MTKLKKKIAVIALYVLLFIGGVSLTEFPESHAYFTTTKNEALEFSANVVSAYHKFTIKLDSSAPKLSTKAPFKFDVDVNKGVNTKTEDKYTFNAPSFCTVTKISGGGALPVSNKNTITLPANSTDNDYTYRDGRLTVNMTCDLVINQDVDIEVSVNETIKNKTFKYADSEVYKLDYSEYKKEIDETVEGTLGPISGTNISIYEEFKAWMQNYTKLFYSDFNESGELKLNPIIKYTIDSGLGKLGTFDKFEDALEAARGGEYSLPGVKIIYDSVNKNYTFKVEDNLLGYARTFNSSQNTPVFMFYFDSTKKETINKAFDYYLKEYIYSDEQVINQVKKYINSQSENGIYGLVHDGDVIPGIGKIEDGHFYINKDMTVQYANATYPVVVKYDTIANMKSYLSTVFSLKQIKNSVSPELINDMMNDPANNRIFFEAIFGGANATQEEKDYYNNIVASDGEKVTIRGAGETINYFIKYDEAKKQYVLFTVWSDGKNGNMIKYYTFNMPEGLINYEYFNAEDKTVNRIALQLRFYTDTAMTDEVFYQYVDQIKELFKDELGESYYQGINAARTRITLRFYVDTIFEDLKTNTDYKLLTEVTTFKVSNKIDISTPSKEEDKKNPPVLNDDSAVTGPDNGPSAGDEIKTETEVKEDPDTVDEKVQEEVKVSDEPLDEDETESTESILSSEDTKNYNEENNVVDKPKEMDVEESIVDKIPPIK